MPVIIDFPTRQVRDMAGIKRQLLPLLREANISNEAQADLFSSIKVFLEVLEFNCTISVAPSPEIMRLQELLQNHAKLLFTNRLDRELQLLGI